MKNTTNKTTMASIKERNAQLCSDSNVATYNDLIASAKGGHDVVSEPQEEIEMIETKEPEVIEVQIADLKLYERMKKVLEGFPQELKELDIWCNWEFLPGKDGNLRKVPVDSKSDSGEWASSNDKSTWSNFDTALRRIKSSANHSVGLGLMLEPPYVGIDLDNIEEDVIRHKQGDFEDNIVSEFVDKVGSYIEESPSGTGVHMIAKGILPEGRRKRGDVEMYCRVRFFTVTGRSFGPNYIKDDTDIGEIPKLHKKYLQLDDVIPVKSERTITTETHNLTDKEVIDRAIASKQGEAFHKLFTGDWEVDYNSQSEADLAFTNMLAFWTAKDGNQMDNIFRESGMMRCKWDELRGHDTYGDITIDNSIAHVRDVYTPKAKASKVFTPSNDRKKVKATWETNQDEPTLEDSKTFPIRSADDTGNAERLVDRYGDIMKYSFKRDKFYVYNGQIWELDEYGLARQLVNYTVDGIEEEDWTEGMEPENKSSGEDIWSDGTSSDKDKKSDIEKKREAQMKHFTKSRSRASKTNMLDLAQVYIPVKEDEFDQDDDVVNTENGYIDLKTGDHHKSDKDMMFSMLVNTTVGDVKKPTRWLQFLDEIFIGNQELIDFVQRAVGYSLTGNINEQCMFILLGEGANGKSTFVETLRELFGSYSSNIQASSLSTRYQGAMTNDLAKLQGSRLVTSSEPEKGFEFDEGLIKEMTGGEVITSRFLFGEEFDYRPNFKLWIATNYKPVISGTDDGIWRRLMLIPFNAKFEGSQDDKNLKEELKTELPGILQWVIEGAKAWYSNGGLNPPTSVINTVKDYRGDMDVIGKFIEDICEVKEDGVAGSTALWDEYVMWVDKNRFTTMNRTEFGEEMIKRYNRKRKSSGVVYEGIEIKI